MSFNGTEGGPINLADAAALTKRYRDRNVGGITAHFIGKEVLAQLLEQDGSMGVRIYMGTDSDGTSKLVLVSAGEDENDNLNLIIDNLRRCPPSCSLRNELNS
jgi:hypothetical protein